MRETADVPANTTGGSESAAMNTSENTHAGTEVVESSPDLSVDGSADETPAESETKTLEDTAEARIDFDDTGAPTPAEVEAAPGDTDGIQATESTNEASSASPVSEEDWVHSLTGTMQRGIALLTLAASALRDNQSALLRS